MQEESKQVLRSAQLREYAESGLSIRSWCVFNGDGGGVPLLAQAAVGSGAGGAIHRAAIFRRPGRPVLELQTPYGYLIRLRSAAQVGWLGAVLAVLR